MIWTCCLSTVRSLQNTRVAVLDGHTENIQVGSSVCKSMRFVGRLLSLVAFSSSAGHDQSYSLKTNSCGAFKQIGCTSCTKRRRSSTVSEDFPLQVRLAFLLQYHNHGLRGTTWVAPTPSLCCHVISPPLPADPLRLDSDVCVLRTHSMC